MKAMYSNSKFDFYHTTSFKQIKKLAEGTNWYVQEPEGYKEYKDWGLEFFVAVSKDFWFDIKHGKVQDKYLFILPSLVIKKRFLKKVEKASTPENIESLKKELETKRDLVEINVQDAFNSSDLYKPILYQSKFNDGNGVVYNLYELIAQLLSISVEEDRLYYGYGYERLYIGNPDHEDKLRLIKELIEKGLEILENDNGEPYLKNLLNEYDEYFRSLTKESKMRLLQTVDVPFASLYYAYERTGIQLIRRDRRILREYVMYNPISPDVHYCLDNTHFMNSDQTVMIRKFRDGLPEPYHSMMADFPVYQTYLKLVRQTDALLSIPLNTDYLFDVIRDVSKRDLVGVFEQLRRKKDDLKVLNELLFNVLNS